MREPLRREALHEALVTPGRPWTGVDVHPSLGSTNAEAVRLARLHHVVLTDHQHAGRGRLGRTWETPAGTSVTLSVLLPVPEEVPGWVPLLTGLAVARGIAEVAGVATALKWPNDVLVPGDGSRKVCGVLCELQPAGVVVGMGINVDQGRDELPVETATSLRLAGASEVRHEALVVAVLDHLADLHHRLLAGGAERAAAQQDYRAACTTTGREVDLHDASGQVTRVRAERVDDEGRLVVVGQGGGYVVAAGDVVHARTAAG
jgi:BirA family transcriptional regulator, biotin operon repressor / biotin---[acetyl-CoA-carboxylase] ligase